LRGYVAKFTCPVSSQLCQIVKSSLLPIWVFCQKAFTHLPTPLSQIAKSNINTSASQVPNSTMSFGYFAKVPSPLHPVNCPNECQAAQQFLGCLTDFSFPACQNLCSQKSD